MRSKLFLALAAVLLTSSFSFAQWKPNDLNLTQMQPKNNWGVNFLYNDKGIGISGRYYKELSKSVNLFFDLSVSGVSNAREFDQYDDEGNAYIENKENKVIIAPLSVGIEKTIFADAIQGFRPYVIAGVAPTLVLTTPYDKGFFERFAYLRPSFAAGGFAGIGMQLLQNSAVAISFDAKYYYLPVIGRDVKSLKDSPINNLGGLQLSFGMNFLR